MTEKLAVKVPGKLMVAGEFAVLERHEPLLVMAVNRFVYGELEDAAERKLTLTNFDLNDLSWQFTNEQVTVDSEDHRVQFVQLAMEITLRYLIERHVQVTPFHLTIRSELDDGAGKKYGLGSSAAVSVTVVALILQKYLGKADPFLVFQLASIAHVSVQGNGSGADIAASAYGGLIKYTSFQAEWLLQQMENTDSIQAIITNDWPYVSIERTTLPEDLDVYVGWTGSPASTGNLVHDILQLKQTDKHAFSTFISASREAVEGCVAAMKANDVTAFMQNITKNRHALTALGKAANVAIDTPTLDALSDIAEAFGGAGKFSGAGGGDCGLAFIHNTDADKRKALFARWEEAGIEPLTLQLYESGIEPS